MTLLTVQQRRELWADYQREISRVREVHDLTKADLRAAVNAVDQWIEDNAASFNQALPLPARTALRAKQKMRLFMAIAKKRFEV